MEQFVERDLYPGSVLRFLLPLIRAASYLTPLNEKIPPSSNEISSVEAWLVLCGHKLPLGSQLVSVLHSADGVVLVGRRKNMIYTRCSSLNCICFKRLT